MRIHKHGLRSLAVLLTVLLVVNTMPLSAAEGTSRAISIGQVSVNGAVDLRGVRITGDGTLFSGDRMNVGSGGYAKVALGAGARIGVDSGSDVTVTQEADKIRVQMASGNVAFKGDGKAPIQFHVGAYEVVVPVGASGNIAYIGKTVFGVRVLTGSVSVRNTLTKKSFSVVKGSEQLISLQTGDVNQPLARLASAVPSAIPALPQGGGQGTAGLSKGGWIAVLGTIGGAAAAVIVLTTRNDDTDDDAATRLAQVKAIQNLSAIAATASATSSAATAVSATATAALNAINNSNAPNKVALAASANVIIGQASSANAKIATLNGQITALQNEITTQGGPPTAAQQQRLNQLLADLESARTEANNAITALNTLLSQAQAANVGGLPQNNTQQVPPANVASASIPN